MIIESTVVANVKVISLSADQWQLYYIEGRDEAADRLNAAMVAAINGNTRKVAYRLCMAALNKESDFGSTDSEGVETLRNILDTIYGFVD